MGAVLHTLNLRLFPEQLAYVINHAEDQVIICDASIAGLLARVRDQIPTVRHIIVVGRGRHRRHSVRPSTTTRCWPPRSPGYDWPQLDERQAAAMCYTSGTTGNPKGVVYSHRSTFLHTMAITSGSSLGISERDSVLSIVPDVPRQRLGHPVRRVHDRGRPDHAPAVPPGRPAGRHHRTLPTDDLGRGADHLERPPALRPDHARSTCPACG